MGRLPLRRQSAEAAELRPVAVASSQPPFGGGDQSTINLVGRLPWRPSDNCSGDQQFPSHPQTSPAMANSLLRLDRYNPSSWGLDRYNRWCRLGTLRDDRDELASKLPDDVLPSRHPPSSSDVGASRMQGDGRDELASKLPGEVLPSSHPPSSGNVGASRGDDRDELTSKLPDDVFPTSHPPPSGDVGTFDKSNRDDRLSNLSDDILLNIVERLDIADAARTSILSRRWKQIPAMLSKIVIMVGSFEPKDDKKSKLTCDDIVRANATMIEATRSILKSRTASDPYSIHLICLQFYLGEESISIGQTVANTISTHKVGLAEFTILNKVQVKCSSDDLLTHGSQFVSFVDACPNAFGALTRLNLERMRLGESEFPKVFSICKCLKYLRLFRCDMGILSLLEVEHPQLSELDIGISHFERVDLKWLPKLTVLTFEGWITQSDPFSLGYVPLLKSVSIGNICGSTHKMLKLSELLCKVTISDLHLNLKCEKIWVKPESQKQLSMVFHRLRLVHLMNISEECDLTWTMFILQGAPSLKELCVTVQDHLCEMITGESRKLYPFSAEKKDKEVTVWDQASLGSFKHSLAVLRIFGFQAQDKFVSYIRTVVKSSVNLRNIYLCDKPVCQRCILRVRRTSMYPRTREERSSIREEISKGTCSPVGIHFLK